MKKQILLTSTILSLVVTLMVKSVSAQSTHYFRVIVPFEFEINDKRFPAGEYIVRRVSSDSPQWLAITSVNARTRQTVLTHKIRNGTLQSESKLVFRRYGDQYFLFQVWAVGDTIGSEIPRSSVERQAEREVDNEKGQSASSAQPAEVVIAAR